MSNIFDPRITPLRLDVAAKVLEGRVDAPEFVEPNLKQLRLPSTMIYKAADNQSEAVNQLLFGEWFDVYREENGWVWGQSKVDDYVGYIRADTLMSPTDTPPNSVVKMSRTPVFSRPSIKSSISMMLDLNARVHVDPDNDRLIDDRFSYVDGAGWILTDAVRPLGHVEFDPAGVAVRFLGAAYVWGGRSTIGCDCSGLTQAALMACGIRAPRDADMQEEELGKEVAYGHDFVSVKRNDLVFWSGHVGIMLDETRLLHANAHFMTVTVEPLVIAAERIERSTGPVTSIKRLSGF